MKKLWILVLCFSVVLLVGCKKNKKSKAEKAFDSFVNHIADSEQTFTSYTEQDRIQDNGNVVYSQDIAFQIERGEQIKTSWSQTVTKLSENVTENGGQFETTKSSYITIGDKKYDTSYGASTESRFEVPKYFLTFTLNRSFFDNYELKTEDKKTTLAGTVKADYVNSFFLGKNLSGIYELKVEIVLNDSKLTDFTATYLSVRTGTDNSIHVLYGYDPVSISL